MAASCVCLETAPPLLSYSISVTAAFESLARALAAQPRRRREKPRIIREARPTARIVLRKRHAEVVASISPCCGRQPPPPSCHCLAQCSAARDLARNSLHFEVAKVNSTVAKFPRRAPSPAASLYTSRPHHSSPPTTDREISPVSLSGLVVFFDA